jgi:hypothetical protein
MVKLLHWCALRISSLAYLVVRLGDHLWEIGGNLELWCDEKHWAKLSKRVAKQHPIKGEAIKAWLAVPVPPLDYTFDPDKPIITMLDEWEDK